MNGCDAGREGELIFEYIRELLAVDKPVKRLWVSSMTKDAIRDGFEHLRDSSEMAPLSAAARSRGEADWLVGMNGTRAATKVGRLEGVVSLGRVQTPTLALIVRRDLEIDAFVPETYFQVDARFQLDQERTLPGPLVRGQGGPHLGARASAGGGRRRLRRRRQRALGQAQRAQDAPAAALRPDQPAARGQQPLRPVRPAHAGRRTAPVRGLRARRRHHLSPHPLTVPALRSDPDAEADRGLAGRHPRVQAPRRVRGRAGRAAAGPRRQRRQGRRPPRHHPHRRPAARRAVRTTTAASTT